MKLAYIATDQSAVKNVSVIHAQNFNTIHFYLSHKNTIEECPSVENLDILANNLNINAQENAQTEAHKSLKKKIKISQDSFINNLYVGKVPAYIDENISGSCTQEVYLLDDIIYLKYNREIGKYSIENSQKQIIEYDYLLIENNQLIMNSILEKQQNLFFSFTEQSRCLLTFEYRQIKALSGYVTDRDFVLIDNVEMHSVFDNWYIISSKADVLRCSFFIPIEMQKNEEYLEFLQNRVKSVLLKNLPGLADLIYSGLSTSPVDGYYKYKAQLRNSRAGALIPKYYLWSDDKRKAHLQSVLKNKNNFKQILLDKKWKRDEL